MYNRTGKKGGMRGDVTSVGRRNSLTSLPSKLCCFRSSVKLNWSTTASLVCHKLTVSNGPFRTFRVPILDWREEIEEVNNGQNCKGIRNREIFFPVCSRCDRRPSLLYPFTPKSGQFQSFPCSLTRNITPHSMENLAWCDFRSMALVRLLLNREVAATWFSM